MTTLDQRPVEVETNPITLSFHTIGMSREESRSKNAIAKMSAEKLRALANKRDSERQEADISNIKILRSLAGVAFKKRGEPPVNIDDNKEVLAGLQLAGADVLHLSFPDSDDEYRREIAKNVGITSEALEAIENTIDKDTDNTLDKLFKIAADITPQELSDLLDQNKVSERISFIDKAIMVGAIGAHWEEKRDSGESYVIHPLRARKLMDLCFMDVVNECYRMGRPDIIPNNEEYSISAFKISLHDSWEHAIEGYKKSNLGQSPSRSKNLVVAPRFGYKFALRLGFSPDGASDSAVGIMGITKPYDVNGKVVEYTQYQEITFFHNLEKEKAFDAADNGFIDPSLIPEKNARKVPIYKNLIEQGSHSALKKNNLFDAMMLEALSYHVQDKEHIEAIKQRVAAIPYGEPLPVFDTELTASPWYFQSDYKSKILESL